MPVIKDSNYETRAELLERCRRQKRTIRVLMAQNKTARQALSRIAEIAAIAAKQISVDAWGMDQKEKEQK